MVERRIDIQYLVFCWQDDSPDNSYYLDLKTGDVRLVNRHLLDLRELTDDIEKTRERYLYLPKPDRQTLLDDLHQFADSVSVAELKPILSVAFESPHVLSAFHKILDKYPDENARLRQFLEDRNLARVEQWLKANAVPKVWDDPDEDLDEDYEDDDDDYEKEDFSVP